MSESNKLGEGQSAAEVGDIKTRYKLLVRRLKEWEHAYRFHDNPLVPDDVYDDSLLRLKELEKKYPELITRDSPTQTIYKVLGGEWKTTKHIAPMLSIGNIHTVDQIKTFCNRNPGVIIGSLKYDGLALTGLYRNGTLAHASTRGDGETGEIIAPELTNHLFPKTINFSGEVEIRGECYLPRPNLDIVNRDRVRRPYVNCRAAAAGIVRGAPGRVENIKYLRFVPYDVVGTELDYLERMSLIDYTTEAIMPPGAFEVAASYADTLVERIGKQRPDLDIDIDGIVFRVNSYRREQELGMGAKFPNYITAYKFPHNSIQTRVKNVEVTVGTTGKLTPVANIEPVIIGGVVVSRATLHNFTIANTLRLKGGDVVWVYRGGEVIPTIDRKLTIGTGGLLECKCPACGDSVVEDGESVYCVKRQACPGTMIPRLDYIVSKEVLDIDGVSTATMSHLFISDAIRHPLDVYRYFNIETTDLYRFILSLCIPGIGVSRAKAMAEHLPNLKMDDLLSIEVLSGIDGIGMETAAVITAVVERDVGRIEELLNTVKLIPPNVVKGKVCVTGTFLEMTRNQLAEILKEKGYELVKTVSKNTNYLVVGDDAGGKLAKAKRLGVKTIKLTEALNLK